MDTLLQDLRFALRSLRRSPGFALVAVLTLALGVGANTAIFSAVNGVLLRPLPYADPDRVVRLMGTRTDGGETRGTVSYPDVMDWRAESSAFEEVAAYDEWTVVLEGEGEAERVAGASVTSPFFAVLGVEPALGRFFRPDEDLPGHEPAVVLSHGLWTRRHGADPAVLGRRLRVGTVEYTVVGVAPEGFEDPYLSGAAYERPQLWRVTPDYFNPVQSSRSGRAFTAVARLRPGVTLAAAGAELDAVSRGLAERYPEDDAGYGVRLVPLREEIVGPLRPALLVLLAATGLVVLIACANVANLLLARGAGRRREMAVRAALGASRGRMVRQLLTESVALAAAGGAVGVAMAAWLTAPLVALGGSELPRADRIGLDLRVLLFAGGVSLLTGLAFGMAPALRAARAELQGTLRGGDRGTADRGESRLRAGLVVAEVALSLLLLSGAGLLVRSLWTLQGVEAGIEADGVLTLELSPSSTRYDTDERIRLLYDELEARIAALPAVTGVGASDILPMSGNFNGMGISIEGRPEPRPGEGLSAETRVVTPGFFPALGIPVLRGRGLSDADRAGASPAVVIDQAMAARHWPGEDPIGKRIVFGRNAWDDISWEVVGVVGNTRQFSLERAPEPTLYLPRAQLTDWSGGATLVVRTGGDPYAVAAGVREVIRSVDPYIPVSDVRSMEEVTASTIAAPRFRTLLLAMLAAVAFALGAVGIYGVVSYTVARRTRELGIRIALGASPRRLLRLVVRQGMGPVLLGAAVGLPLALAGSRLLSGMLYGVAPADPVTFGAVTAALCSVAALACWLPARRATRVDPVVALRND